ncbi:hypothetical protein [Sinomonas terrae]|uniref:Uncharacterized protein n=1 Tax=Sinomonas terrae TaxID=2908838 RepID=A0ABS9U709_9MICC|nr:hypothetical protein [Sinomonas terrae]MCH6472459.1 hypothetical protein [Sinomonas terrae]
MPSPALVSALLGFVALFTVGFAIPESVVDSWLGGTNLLHLIRNLLFLVSMWFLRRAICLVLSRPSTRRNPIPLLVQMLVMAVFFAASPRGPTTGLFIPEYVHEPGIWAYANVYMAGVLWLAVDIIRLARTSAPRPLGWFWWFSAGGILISMASLVELVYMSVVPRFGRESAVAQSLYPLFSPLLYSGIAAIVVGLCIPPVTTLVRRAELPLRLVNARAKAICTPRTSCRRSAATAFVSGLLAADPRGEVYDTMIQLRDGTMASVVSLTAAQLALLVDLEQRFPYDQMAIAIPKEVRPDEAHP